MIKIKSYYFCFLFSVFILSGCAKPASQAEIIGEFKSRLNQNEKILLRGDGTYERRIQTKNGVSYYSSTWDVSYRDSACTYIAFKNFANAKVSKEEKDIGVYMLGCVQSYYLPSKTIIVFSEENGFIFDKMN